MASDLPRTIKVKSNGKEFEMYFSHVVEVEDKNYAVFVGLDEDSNDWVAEIFRLESVSPKTEEGKKVLEAWGKLGEDIQEEE